MGLFATFNPDMIFEVAKAISFEVRAYNNYYVKNSDYQFHHGLSSHQYSEGPTMGT